MVIRVEAGEDVKLSTMEKYVAALDGELLLGVQRAARRGKQKARGRSNTPRRRAV